VPLAQLRASRHLRGLATSLFPTSFPIAPFRYFAPRQFVSPRCTYSTRARAQKTYLFSPVFWSCNSCHVTSSVTGQSGGFLPALPCLIQSVRRAVTIGAHDSSIGFLSSYSPPPPPSPRLQRLRDCCFLLDFCTFARLVSWRISQIRTLAQKLDGMGSR